MSTRSTPLPGGPEVARIGTASLIPLYLFLGVLDAFTFEGLGRWVLCVSAAVTVVVAAERMWSARRSRGVSTACAVWFACGAPVVNSLLQVLVSGRLEQTTVLMLAMVAAGAMMTRVDHAVVLLATAVVAWVGIVAVERPQPAASTPHFAIQLMLATALAGAVLQTRTVIGRRLAASLARFRGVFDDSPVGISLSDEHGRFVQVNQALCRLLDRTEDEILGGSQPDITHPDITHPEDAHLGGAALRRLDGDPDGVTRFEKRYLRRDQVRWASLSITHVDGPGGARWTLAHVQDVTERREADEAVARGREALAAAAEISRITQLGGNPRSAVVRQLLSLAGASSVSLMEAQGADRLIVTAAVGKPGLVGFEIDLTEPSATAHVWGTGRPLFVSSTQTHPLVNRRLIEQSDARAMQWQPVGVDGTVSAVLAIVWDSSKAGVTEVDRSVVDVLAAETGAALAGERLRRDLERLSLRDPLTGLLNRRGWDRDVATLRAGVESLGREITVAVVDLDFFKRYNDAHGHAAGDELLTQFAEAATRALRHTDLLARWGGEEFTVALVDTDGVGAPEAIARLRAAVPGRETCSVGFAQLRHAESVADCLLRADQALYAAKERGRDQAVDADTLLPPSSGAGVGLVA